MQYKYGDWERKRILEKNNKAKQNFIMGLIMAPCLFIGPFLIVWTISKIFK